MELSTCSKSCYSTEPSLSQKSFSQQGSYNRKKQVYKEKDQHSMNFYKQMQKNSNFYHRKPSKPHTMSKYQIEYEGTVYQLGETWQSISSTIDQLIKDRLMALSTKICLYKRIGLQLEKETEKMLYQAFLKEIQLTNDE